MGPQSYQSSSAVRTDQRLFQRVFSWMFTGLLLTGIIAYFLSSNGNIKAFISFHSLGVFWGAVIVEFIVVIALQALIGKLSPFAATFMFFLYAAINGITFSVLLAYVDISTVGSAFIIAAGMFGTSAALGYITKIDLSRMGAIFIMFVWGIFLASVVNIFFLHISGLNLIISYVVVALFCGITAYDIQNIKRLNASMQSMDEGTGTKVAIYGALMLYINFISILWSLINILSRD